MTFVQSLDLEAQSSGEVFFVAEHHVDKGSERAIYFLRFWFSSDGFPERAAIIQIIRDDGSRALGGLHCFSCYLRSCFRQRAKNPAGVKPARALFDKDCFPVDLAGLELRNEIGRASCRERVEYWERIDTRITKNLMEGRELRQQLHWLYR